MPAVRSVSPPSGPGPAAPVPSTAVSPDARPVLHTASLASQVQQRLRAAIIDGEFALGAMIPEEQLAAFYGVSRTPVREALTQLQRSGLVVVRPQRGSFVFEPTADDVAQLCEFRCVIEPSAAALAYAHGRSATIAAVRGTIDDMQKARHARDARRYGRADTRFHEAFVAHCGNPYFQAAYATVGDRIATLRRHLSAPADVLAAGGIGQHRQLLALFRRGELDGFAALLREHVQATRARHLDSLGRQAR